MKMRILRKLSEQILNPHWMGWEHQQQMHGRLVDTSGSVLTKRQLI